MTDGIRVRIFGDDSDLQSTLTQSTARIAKFSAAAVAAGAAIAVSLTRSSMKAADASAKLARSLDGTIDGLQALRMAAGDAGIDGLEASLNRMNRRLGAVEMAGGPAVKTIERLGLDLAYIQSLDVDQRIGAIADRMIELDMSSQEAARHLQQLGFEQRGAIELFRGGSEAIDRYRQEVDAFGLALSEVDAAKIEAANDAMGILGDMTQAVGQRMAVAAAGPLRAMAEAIEQAWIETENFGLAAADFEQRFARAVASALEGSAALIRMVESRPEMAQMGMIGFLLFGRKGLAIGTAIGAVFTQIRRSMAQMGIGTDAQAAALVRLENRMESIRHLMDSNGQGFQLSQQQAAEYAAELAQLAEQAEQMREAMGDDSLAAYRDLLGESAGNAEGFAAALERVAQAVRDSAESGEAMTPRRSPGTAGAGAGGMSPEEQAAIEERLAALQESFMTEQEMLALKYEQERELLRQSLENELLDREEYARLIEESARKYQNEMTRTELEQAEARKQIAQAEADAKLALTKSIFGDISTLMNTESRKLFEIGKAAAIANAIVDTHAGMTKALAQGGFRGIAMAAAVAAKGFASVSAIRSQSFGGGGAGAAATGSNTAAVNAATTPAGQPQQQQAGPSTVIRLSGDFFGESQIRSLIERINETTRNGGRIVLG